MHLLKSLLANVLVASALATVPMLAQADAMDDINKNGTLTIAVQTQGPPVSFIDKNGERAGLAVDIARMFADDMGVKLVIQDYDWKGLIPALTSGKADLIAADMTPSAKRNMQVLFTNPVFYLETVAFANKDKHFKSWQALNNPAITVGATQASSYADATKKILPQAQLKEFGGGNAQTVQAVVSGRADAGISDRAQIATFINATPELEVLDGTMTKEPLSFATRPDSVHLLLALNNYIRLIEIDGRLKERTDYWWNSTAWEADHK